MNRTQDSERWIWPFELLEKIGEGGMGEVYRARYVVNDKFFAVKLLPKDVTDETTLARFRRELEILTKLKHPNIVRCFGGECKDKRQFYAMELVEGGTLDDLLHKRGKLAWELIVEYGLQMCSALAYSHKHGVVHRDIKPGNFLITAAGRLKLSDFGLASVAASRRITAEGRTMGTYQYMAPEQIRGKNITPKTDLYSLGCVFFELLSGRPPFEGEAAAAILHKHIKEAPPRVGQFAPDCPAGLEQLIGDLLEKDPQARPANAEVIAKRLKAITQTITVKEHVRPFEQSSSKSAPELTDTKSAPTIQPTVADRAPVSSPRAKIALVGVIGVLCFLIASLMDSYPRDAERAEDLWIASLNGENVPVQVAAAEALGELGKTSESATQALLTSLEELQDVPPPPPDSVTTSVTDANSPVLAAVVKAVGAAGYGAKEQIGPLKKLAKEHPDQNVRSAAMTTIESLKNAENPGRSGWYFLKILAICGTLAGMGWVMLDSKS